MPAKIVSFINLKGGVGKTTLALAIGEFLAFATPRNRVLLIDLDAQSNLSYALFSETTLLQIWNSPAEQSVYHMFKAALEEKDWDINKAIMKNSSNIDGNSHLHALVCSPDLGQLDEDILTRLEKGQGIAVDFRKVLGEQLEKVKANYDWIIIDCPPSLSTLTSNAILCSDYFIVPLVPEALSVLGMQLIQRRLGGLKRLYGETQVKIEFAGAIVNRIDIRRSDHVAQAKVVYLHKDQFAPFDHWVGDWKPLYIVSDYGYPFAKQGRAWSTVLEKYGNRNRRTNPGSPILRNRRGSTLFYGSFYINDRIFDLAREFEQRCK